MQIAVDVHLMGGKITADEEIGTLLAIGNEQFIAHITVTVVVSRLMANEDVAGAVVFCPSPKPKSGIPLTGRIVSKGRCTQPGVIYATGVLPQCMEANGSIPIARVVFFKRRSPDSGVFFPFVFEEGFVTTGGVVMARGVAEEGTVTAGGVVMARGVAEEGSGTDGGVVIARGVAEEGMGTTGGVVMARGVFEEGTGTTGGVVNAHGVAVEGIVTTGGVVMALGVLVEGIVTTGGVVTALGVFEEGSGTDGDVVIARGEISESM